MTSYAQGFAPQQPQQQPRQGFGQQMQGMFGGYQPSRQGFGQQRGFGGFGGGYGMPQQQQGFGGGFGGGYGGGFGGYGMPQQFGGFGGFGGYGMPQQFGGFGGYGMPQQQQGFGNTFARTMPPQQQGLGGSLSQMSGFNEMRQQQQANPASLANAYQDMLRGMGGMGGGGGSQSAAPQPLTQPMPPQQEGRIDPNTYTRSPFNLEGGQQAPMDVMQRQQQLMQQAQMPGNPYAQQIRQEDPRMQAMRYMQRMRFAGPEGYTF